MLTLGFEFLSASAEHFRLLRIERDLLLATIDIKFVTVHHLARRDGDIVGGRQLKANASQVVFDFGEPRGGDAFVGARLLQAGPRRLDRVRQRAVTSREQDFFPPAHLVAQAGVATGLAGLALQ